MAAALAWEREIERERERDSEREEEDERARERPREGRERDSTLSLGGHVRRTWRWRELGRDGPAAGFGPNHHEGDKIDFFKNFLLMNLRGI